MTATVDPRTVTLRDAEALVGMPYVEGTFDCAHLAVLAQHTLFGRDVLIPGRHPAGLRTQAAAIARLRFTVAEQVDLPATGDVALFIAEAAAGALQWHIGTVFLHGGDQWVLHTRADDASRLQRVADVLRFGMLLEGFYRWKTSAA